MRKLILITFIPLLLLSLFSCTSTKVSEDLSPTIEIKQEPESVTENSEPEEIEKVVSEPQFPIPLEIVEPEIVTLEPEDIPVAIPEEKEEDPVKEELIVVEEPKPIISDIEKNQEEKIPEEKVPVGNITETNESEVIEEVSQPEKSDDAKAQLEAATAQADKEPAENHQEEEKNDDAEENEDVVVVESEEMSSASEESKEKPIVPSRSVTLKVKEYLDVTYPGSGWIYMGQTDGARDLTYFGRGLGTKDTTFTLQARKPGTKILHFYKNDHLTNEYLDDYIEVIVLEQVGSNKTHIAAPAYKQPVPEKAKELYYKVEKTEDKTVAEEHAVTEVVEKKADDWSSASQEKSEDKVIEKNIPKSEKQSTLDSNTLLKEAQLLYNEEEYKAALEKIDLFFTVATKYIDQGLYLKGQILEAKSEVQDIKNAIASYSRLTKEYPASRYWDSANKRIVYLKRFYLEVR